MKNEFKWLTVIYAAVVTVSITLVFIPCLINKVQSGYWYLLFCFVFYSIVIAILLVAVVRSKWFEVTTGRCLQWSVFWSTAIILGVLALPIVLCRSPPENPHIDLLSAVLSVIGHLMLIFFSCIFFYRVFYAKHNNIW